MAQRLPSKFQIKTATCKACSKKFTYKSGFAMGAERRIACSKECRMHLRRQQALSSYRRKHPDPDNIRKRSKIESVYGVSRQNDHVLFYDLLYLTVDDCSLGTEVLDSDIQATANFFNMFRESRLAEQCLAKHYD